MKNRTFAIFIRITLVVFMLYGCKSKQSTIKHEKFSVNKLNKDFIGTWKFVKRLDANGKKVDTIRHGKFREIVSGPLTIFKKDGTYSMKFTVSHKQFTYENTDVGKWQYNPNAKKMTLYLFIKPDDWIGKDLISRGIAKKYDDGKYYETLKYKIIRISKDTLQYIDYNGANMIYGKVK